MATFYQGSRSVLKGRNANDSIHTWKGTAGTYSNWSLFNTSHVLDGAPNSDHVPGEGRHPHGLAMSRWFLGLQNEDMPLRAPGHTDDQRYRPLENKAAGNNRVFKAVYGHAPRVTDYSAWDAYDDTNRQRRLDDPGHAIRGIDATGTAYSFGRFDPHIYQGVDEAVEDPGQSLPATAYESDLGHNRINEWRGVAACQALNI